MTSWIQAFSKTIFVAVDLLRTQKSAKTIPLEENANFNMRYIFSN